ncbi:MAG: hypothetical protein LN415_07830 [Candidatus Thermoplasmatota archaeon]|nr:hypothetical protein [Candidatus Thermoplasmatota archaeon]
MTDRVEGENGHGDAFTENAPSEWTSLKLWQEVVGSLEHASYDENLLEVRMTTKNGLLRLVFHRDSPEAKRIHDVLLDLPRGSRIGLLRTDSKSSPILIRIVPGQLPSLSR